MKHYRPEDIEIFILSYNRADYITATIQSLINQSVHGFDIIVLDNGSTDHTEDVVKQYFDKGVKFVGSSENLGFEFNFGRAQRLASKEWVIAFHDDDLMHPRQIETFLKAVNESDTITLAVTGLIPSRNPDVNCWNTNKEEILICKDAAELAAKCYFGFSLAFSSVIYRTERFKNTPLRYDIYGKIFDRPFLFAAADNGKVAVLKGCEIQYRLHGGQDSGDYSSGPFVNQILSLHKTYKSFLGDSYFNKRGRAFLMNNYRHLYGKRNDFDQ